MYFILILFLYIAAVYLLDKKLDLIKKTPFHVIWILSVIPIVLIGTNKLQKLIDIIASKKKIWYIFGNISIFISLVSSLGIFLLVLIFSISMIFSIPDAPGKIYYFPGPFDLIPVYYGLAGIIIAFFLHEFSHVILCKVEGIDVKSYGFSFLLWPLSIYTDLDSDKLLKSDAISSQGKMRIFSSGIAANLLMAFIAFILFFSLLNYIEPVGTVMVTDIESPAYLTGVKPNMILIGINNVKVETVNDFLSYIEDLEPGSRVTLSLLDEGVKKEISLVTIESDRNSRGLRVFDVIGGSPAEAAGIKADMFLVKINDAEINDLNDFKNFLSRTKPGEKIDIYLMSNDSENASLEVFRDVELEKYPYKLGIKNGFLGLSILPFAGIENHATGITIAQSTSNNYLQSLRNIPSSLTEINGWLMFFSLPVYENAGFDYTVINDLNNKFYKPIGWAVSFGDGIFIIINVLMWIGFMNFYLGIFWSLPISYSKELHYLGFKNDGGSLVKEILYQILSVIFDRNKSLKISEILTRILAIITIILFIWILVFSPM